MNRYFEIWGVPPNQKNRIKISEYDEKYWQRAEKKAARLEDLGYEKIVIYEKTRNDSIDKGNSIL